MGKITTVPNVPKSVCDFAHNAMNTPKEENTKKEIIRASINSGLIDIRGDRKKPTMSRGTVLIKPRTTPTKVLPTTIEERLIGDIKHSSKHL